MSRLYSYILKTTVLFLVFTFFSPVRAYSQVTQNDSEPNLKAMVDDAQKKELPVSIAFYSMIVPTLVGLGGLGAQLIPISQLDGFRDSPFRHVFPVSLGIGVLGMLGTGVAWAALHNWASKLIQIQALVAFEIHITSTTAYAPVNVSGNATSSRAFGNGTLSNETEWDMGDGQGFQKLGPIVNNFTIQNPGVYAIQVRVTDSNGNQNIGTYSLNVLDANPTVDVALNYSNPYKSSPTNVTFSIGPVHALFPCASPVHLNCTLVNETTLSLNPNSTTQLTRTYVKDGDFPYTLVSVDSSGRKTVSNLILTVQSPNPIASIQLTQCSGSSYILDPSGSRVNALNATIVSYTWSSTDSSIGSRVTYPPHGQVTSSVPDCWASYLTSLIVTDSEGRTGTANWEVNFQYDPDCVCGGW